MSGRQLLANPVRRTPDGLRLTSKTCPFASNCSCVFAGPSSAHATKPLASAPFSETTRAEIAEWQLRGFVVVSTDAHEVVLERTRPTSFCVNVLLVMLTASLWAFVWARRARHPRIERHTVTILG
ncbi:hypothetical protein [Subtercola vilae]|uniref:Uncharacterized protein n=1 Tax=Subtercola vilae TaxID=2056433 RepID=A0A4T2C893_9MICO|nr:hypothetical protein [Subtercola vilae]TIH40663.1 hypothetical protein D4765_01385 [Subtercola vilae]